MKKIMGNRKEIEMAGEREQLRKFYKRKSKFPDVLFLFRVGKAFELYERDAAEAARILEVPVLNGPVMNVASLPEGVLGESVSRLVKAGKAVTVME